MRRILLTIRILAVLTAAALFASCNHKDLCYGRMETTRIRVVYDWRNAPDATASGMCVFFYSQDDPGRYYRFDFPDTTGGEVEIPAGRYLLITYNNDTEAVRFSATNSFVGHRATTRTADLLEPLYGNAVTSNTQTDNGEEVMLTPDALWGCHATDVTVTKHGVTYTIINYDDTRADAVSTVDQDGNQTITLFPHDMLCHYSYEVRGVDNADKISLVSGALSGMAGSMTLSDEALDPTPVTLPVPGAAHSDKKQITGQFLTFGHNPANGAAHRMTFYVVMADGSKYVVSGTDNLDVTGQVDGAPDRRHVHIIIDNLRLPDASDPDQGWLPTVDDWGVINEDIPI